MLTLVTSNRESNFSNIRRLAAVCAVAILSYSLFQWPIPQIDLRLVLLTIITIVISSRFAVKIPRVNTNITISDTFIFLALLIYGPLAAVWLATIEGFSSGMHISKRPLTIAFNSAMMTCATFGTILVIQTAFGPVSSLRSLPWQSFLAATLIMALTQYAINTGLSCLGLIVHHGGRFFRTWYKHYLWTGISFIASAAIAAATASSFEKAGVPVLMIAAPVIALIYFTYHKYLNEVKEAAEQAEHAERERAEAAERHVQELNQITENIRQVIWIQSSQSKEILYINPYYETLFGLTREELYDDPQAFLRIVHPDDLATLIATIDKRANQPTDVQFRIHPTRDETRWIHSRTVPIHSDQILGAAQDVTEHKNMEIALRDSEHLYRELFNSANDIVYTTDLEGRYTSINKRGRDITGYTSEEALSLNFADIAKPEDVALGREMLRRKIERGSNDSTVYEISIKAKDGSYLPIEVNTQLIFKEGKPVGAQGIARDITERKAAEAALKKSEAQHRQLFESNPQPIYVVDNQTYRILATNPAANKHYGYTTNEFRSLTLANIWPDFSTNVYAQLTEANDNKTVFQHITKTGDFIDVEIVSRPIEFEDRQARLLLLKDVTAHRRAEAEQRAREAADESARIKSEFLANMSHEIRTPMNGILGMTELALQTSLSGQQRSYLEIVQSSSLSLLTIINDILDFSKIEAGKLTLEEIPFNLSQLVGELTRALALPAHEKRLELAWQTATDIPSELIGDPIRLRQILTNLVSNAIKFTDHGEVVIRIKQIASQDNKVSLNFAISDTGIGIPRDKQMLIFQSFAQADGSTTRKYGGTGLGLAISAQLVHLMGGSLEVESKEDQGSTFHFTIELPRHEATNAAQHTAPKFENLNVLIVDDNSTNRIILEETLTHWRMCPKTVTCGRDAITAIKTASHEGQPFSLVLLDACMPEMDGFEVARQLKTLPEIASTTIMMLTSIDHHLSTNHLHELGIAQSLVKPISQSELHTAIQKLLDPSAAPITPITAAISNEQLPPQNLLLVEDNLTNQKFAIWTLEKEGHTITAVGNGLKALEALKENTYDAILMDIQMPVMNGLDATRQIRKEEESTGRHIPIIAMTALAMKGDKERCLAAGMDDYISKPILTEELFNALHRILDHSPKKEPATPLSIQPERAQSQSNGHKTFDRSVFLGRISNNQALAIELVKTFLTETRTITAEIERAIHEQNDDLLYRGAHTLKSSAAIFGAEPTRALATELETMGRENTTANAPQTFSDLQKELDFLYQDLEQTFLAPAPSEPPPN